MKKCTGCDRLDNVPLGLNDKGDKYLACCPDNNYIEMTVVEWLEEQLDIDLVDNGWYFEKAKEMEKQEKLKIQIAENESVLEMLRLHGNDSSIMRVFSRLESLKEQLKEMEL
jgi:hypothetical protein